MPPQTTRLEPEGPIMPKATKRYPSSPFVSLLLPTVRSLGLPRTPKGDLVAAGQAKIV